jgi:ribonuclease D
VSSAFRVDADPALVPGALITDDGRLELVAEAARSAGRIGLDTEFMRERTYRARLCLVQVATPEDVYLIDPLSGVDLAPIMKLVADSGVEVVVHAGRQDLELLYERFGVVPSNVFDVQLAAGFAGRGASLPYGGIVKTILGVTLVKGEAYSDWCRRPLTQEQITYAGDDVRYLLDIADRLKDRLTSLGRLEWALEELEVLQEEDTYLIDPGEAWRRISGRGSLTGRQTAILKEVARWREKTAAQRDLPRNWIIKDPTLIEIARRAPTTRTALKSIRGINAKEADRSGGQILEAVRRGRETPAVPAPPSPPREVQARTRMLSSLADAVVRSRCERAEISMEVVTTRAELEAVLTQVFSGRLDESGHRLLRGWRRELAGDALLALIRGTVALKVVDRPPYVEETPLS